MHPMGDFAADTAVQGSDGRYRAHLSRDWEIWGPNGGYLASIALQAAGAATPLRRPATFSCHFLSVADFGDVDVNVTTLRSSKRAASLRIAMTQKQNPILEAIVWVVAAAAGLQHDVAQMPRVPPPEQLQSVDDLITADDRELRHPFWNNLEERPIRWVPWAQRQPGRPEWMQWYRFRPRSTFDDPFVDAARALLLIDTMGWPAAASAHPRDSGFIAPSIDVNVQFHRTAPQSEWLLSEQQAAVACDGLIGATARVWSDGGQLLASGGCQMLCRRLAAP
jgi:acyl-CoA thioesterase-2